jgi:hypothetical protein
LVSDKTWFLGLRSGNWQCVVLTGEAYDVACGERRERPERSVRWRVSWYGEWYGVWRGRTKRGVSVCRVAQEIRLDWILWAFQVFGFWMEL